MSVVCTVAAAGTVYASASVLSGLAAAAASAMALRQLHGAEASVQREETEARLREQAEAAAEASSVVELGGAQTQALGKLVAERCQMIFADEQLTLELTRDVRGVLTVRAHGRGLDRAEVSERAARFLGLLQQQVAYREVVEKMRRYGLQVQQEARLEDGTVKVRIGAGRR